MTKIDIVKNELNIKGVNRVINNFILNGKIGNCLPRPFDGFVYILDGICNYSFNDGQSFSAKKGDLLYLAKNSVYQMDIDCAKYSFIFCDFEFLSEEPRQSAVYTLKNPDEIEIIFSKMAFLYGAKRVAWQSDCSSLLYGAYSKLIRSFENYSSAMYKKIAQSAQGYFLENLSNPNLSIKETADFLGVSEVHLRRVFGSVFGISPVKYVISERIILAKELIKLPYMSIEEVAKQCGFSTQTYFFKTFKKITGKTPSAFRKSDI